MDGKGPYQITQILKKDKVQIPAYHQQQLGIGLYQSRELKNPYRWSSSTITHILCKKEYLGHTVNFKTRKHYKDKKSHYVDEKHWMIFENTHEPIIDQVTFDNVQRIRNNVKRYPNGWGEVNPLTGLLYCSDCGGKLYGHRNCNNVPTTHYVCGNYGKVPVGTRCKSGHRIREDNILEMIKTTLQGLKKTIENDKSAFMRTVQETMSQKQIKDVKAQQKRLLICKKRVEELKILLSKIYEDNAFGKLPDKRYEILNIQYESEQFSLEEEIEQLSKVVTAFEDGKGGAKQFIDLISKYENFEPLSIAMLNEFIEKIVVYERERKGSVDTTQRVDIFFNFIGQFEIVPEPIDTLLQREIDEERRKKEETKERLHRNYLRRKESGHQAQWEQQYKERRFKLKIEKQAQLPQSGIHILKYQETIKDLELESRYDYVKSK